MSSLFFVHVGNSRLSLNLWLAVELMAIVMVFLPDRYLLLILTGVAIVQCGVAKSDLLGRRGR